MKRYCILCKIDVDEKVMDYDSGMHFCPDCGIQLLYRIPKKPSCSFPMCKAEGCNDLSISHSQYCRPCIDHGASG